jgi:mono/diheme cytochrome c family protein
MGEAVDASFSQMTPEDVHALVSFVRSVPPIATPDLPATLAPPAPASPKDGNKEGPVAANTLGKKIFAEACVSCHNWTGVSAIAPYATIAGARAVNDPTATNVAQIVISGTRRHEPAGVISMPAFGSVYSDTEIAAVANYVTARFGSEKSAVTENDIAALRKQTSR